MKMHKKSRKVKQKQIPGTKLLLDKQIRCSIKHDTKQELNRRITSTHLQSGLKSMFRVCKAGMEKSELSLDAESINNHYIDICTKTDFLNFSTSKPDYINSDNHKFKLCLISPYNVRDAWKKIKKRNTSADNMGVCNIMINLLMHSVWLWLLCSMNLLKWEKFLAF